MAKKLEDRLKAKGLTQTDLDSMKVLLDNPSYRAAIEGDMDAQDAEIARLNGVVAADKKWYDEEATPAIQQAQKKATDALAAKAAAEARLASAKEYGLEHLADGQNGTKEDKEVDTPTTTVDTSKFITSESLQQFADKETEGMALLADLQNEHRRLFGKELSARELVTRWKQGGRGSSLESFWETTYGVSAKRDEIKAKETSDNENRIRADERQKVMSERNNPQTRPGVSSNQPWTTARPKAGEAKQPWDMSAEGRQVARVNKVVQKQQQFVN